MICLRITSEITIIVEYWVNCSCWEKCWSLRWQKAADISFTVLSYLSGTGVRVLEEHVRRTKKYAAWEKAAYTPGNQRNFLIVSVCSNFLQKIEDKSLLGLLGRMRSWYLLISALLFHFEIIILYIFFD